MKHLEIKESESVTEVFLNRPDVKNAMNAEMIEEIRSFFASVKGSVRAIVLRGRGDFFCAGGDLNWMKSSMDKTEKDNEADALNLAKMVRAVDECPVPVITAVHGGAFGGGVGIVAASDIVIAEESSLFSLSEVKLGLIPATIGPLVMRKIGVSEARRLYLTGKRFDAKEAKHLHLVHEVVSGSEGVETSIRAYLKEIGSSGPAAIRVGKNLIRDMMGAVLWEPEITEETSKVLSKVRIGEEAQEGMRAFLAKERANWSEKL